MARNDEAGQLLRDGLTPQQIAEHMGISLSSVRQYLCQQVGEGELRRSDIAFKIDERPLIENALRNLASAQIHDEGPNKTLREASKICSHLSRLGHKIPRDLIELYLATRDALPDLYALICEIEVSLHRTVKLILENEFGNRWWREGIPETTRIQCQTRREADHTPLDEPYHYTTFIDLKSVIDSNWRVFSTALPKAFTANKKQTLHRLDRINSIRNRVMHPVKEIVEYEDDYRFARELLVDLRN